MTHRNFSLGQIVATPEALKVLTKERIADILAQYLACDWGIVDKEDWKLIDIAVRDGTRILSAYWVDEQDHRRGMLWVTTVAEVESESGPQRPYTTIFLPEKY